MVGRIMSMAVVDFGNARGGRTVMALWEKCPMSANMASLPLMQRMTPHKEIQDARPPSTRKLKA